MELRTNRIWLGVNSDMVPPKSEVHPGDEWHNASGQWEFWNDGKWHRISLVRHVSEQDVWQG